MPRLLKLQPRYVTEIPNPGSPGRMTHLQIAKTEFGGDWGATADDFYFGSPLYRAVKQMSGSPNAILSRNPAGIHVPYCLLWSAVSDSPGNSEYNSFWVQLAEQFATTNGYDPEDLFIHTGSAQHTLVSKIDHIDADGTVHLGLIGSHYYRTTLMHVGDQYIIEGSSNATFNGQCTILAIVDYRTFVIDKTAGAAGTDGSIYQLGDGSRTKANRFQFFLWDNWRYTLNPGTAAAKQWAIFKQAQSMGAQSRGVFYDEFDSTDIRGVSLEYPLDADYESGLITLLESIKAAFPGKLTEVNIGAYTKQADFDFSVAAGANQLEQFSDVLSSYSIDTMISWITSLMQAGVYVGMSMVPEWRQDLPGKKLGLPSAFVTAGGHNYSTPEARCYIVSYATYMQLVDSDVNTYGNYHLFWEPLPGKIECVDKLSKWYSIVEHGLGRAMGPYYVLVNGNLAQDGGAVRVWARKFTLDGTSVHCLMLNSRSRFGQTKQFDSGTQCTVPVEPAPAGTSWWLMDENGQFKFEVVGSINLWCAEAAFLIAVPK